MKCTTETQQIFNLRMTKQEKDWLYGCFAYAVLTTAQDVTMMERFRAALNAPKMQK